MEEQIQVRRVPGFWTLLVTGSGRMRRLPGLRRIAFRFTYGDQRPYQPGRCLRVRVHQRKLFPGPR